MKSPHRPRFLLTGPRDCVVQSVRIHPDSKKTRPVKNEQLAASDKPKQHGVRVKLEPSPELQVVTNAEGAKKHETHRQKKQREYEENRKCRARTRCPGCIFV